MSSRRNFLRRLAGVPALAATSAWAQERYPSRPIRVVVPLTAGSSIDARARNICDILGERTRWNVIVDNRPGAGGNIGATAVARSAADGHTLLYWNNTYNINPHVYRAPGYEPRDFAPITPVTASAVAVVVNANSPARTLHEFVSLARARPGALSYASSGVGSAPHFATALFAHNARIELLHVPFKGDGQSVPEVVAGRVDVAFAGVPAVVPHIKAGSLRPLAVSTAKRVAALPEVPTYAELGFAAAEFTAWTGLLAPAATPRPVVLTLHRELVAAAATPRAAAFRELSGAFAFTTNTPEEFAAFLNAEYLRFARLVRELDLRIE
jgi:tripartite-type tricarboxylate transporter receptor subunit TctC